MGTASIGQLRASLIVSLNQLAKKREKAQQEEDKELSIQIKTLTRFGMENGLLYPADVKTLQI